MRRVIPSRTLLAVGLAVALAGAAAADTLTITADPNPVPAGVAVTFRITPEVFVQGDTVTFDFKDGGTGTIEYSVGCAILHGCGSITHTYAGAGAFAVAATGTIAGHAVGGTVQLTVSSSTSDEEMFVGTGANLKGFNNVNWKTDLQVVNAGPYQARYAIALLIRNQDNGTPTYTTQFTLEPGRSARYVDLLQVVFGFSGAAAIRITPIAGSFVVTSRTYNQLPAGTYGQSVPAIPRSQAINFGEDALLPGLTHEPSLASDYRTNIGLVNASPAPIHVEVELHLRSGARLGTVSLDLLPLEFRQIDKAFEQLTSDRVDDGYAVARTTTAGARFFAYASVIDNLTGDPTYVPAMIPK